MADCTAAFAASDAGLLTCFLGAVIERVRQDDPATYIRVIAGLLPKELKIDRRPDAGPLSDLTDEELTALACAARNAVAQADAAAAEQGSSEHSS